MTVVTEVLTENIGTWTQAMKPKSSAGRGGVSGIELYGLSQLRKLILNLAVRGLLLPQDPNDRPASELLEQLTVEKQRRVADKLIKKQRSIPEFDEKSHAQELPLGWAWATLSHLGSFSGGKTPSKAKPLFWGGAIPWVTPKDMKTHEIFDSQDHVTDLAVATELDVYKPGAVLIVARSGILRRTLPVAITRVECTVNQDLKVLSPYLTETSEYIQLLCRGFEGEILKSLTKTGTTVESLVFEQFAKHYFMLPPLAEQHRIIAKVDELMALCDKLEAQQADALEAHKALVTTVLGALTKATEKESFDTAWARIAEHFDILFTTEGSVDQLEQAILNLGVLGSLLPEGPNSFSAEDEFAAVKSTQFAWLKANMPENPEAKTMLRKLKKLGNPVPLPRLPEHWVSVYLIQLTYMLVDCHNKTAPYVDSGIPIIRTTNIRDRRYLPHDQKYVSEDTYKYWSRRCPPLPADLIFTREAPMGEALIIPDGERWCLGQRTMLIRPIHDLVSNRFLLLALTESTLLSRASEGAIGSTVKHLRVGDVEELVIPLPPLEEQLRIVAKVDELLAICDQLRVAIHEVRQTQLLLADAITEQAIA